MTQSIVLQRNPRRKKQIHDKYGTGLCYGIEFKTFSEHGQIDNPPIPINIRMGPDPHPMIVEFGDKVESMWIAWEINYLVQKCVVEINGRIDPSLSVRIYMDLDCIFVKPMEREKEI